MVRKPKILFYGYGNPGRQDDALGICFIEELQCWVEKEKLDYIFFDSNYQLNIEDADRISTFDLVFFVDASMEAIETFSITEVQESSAQVEFTMHAISPGVVLNLCRQIYSSAPIVYLISIKGYEWDLDFDRKLSEKARQNMQAAWQKTKTFLQKTEGALPSEIKQIIALYSR